MLGKLGPKDLCGFSIVGRINPEMLTTSTTRRLARCRRWEDVQRIDPDAPEFIEMDPDEALPLVTQLREPRIHSPALADEVSWKGCPNQLTAGVLGVFNPPDRWHEQV